MFFFATNIFSKPIVLCYVKEFVFYTVKLEEPRPLAPLLLTELKLC